MTGEGWRSRGYLPHFDHADMIQHVVFGMADAFVDERQAPEDAKARYHWRERGLDEGHGACLLVGEAAIIVEDALLHFDRERYGLYAWCVMPNHVHVLVGLIQGWPLSKIVHSWKSFAANGVNAFYNRTGALWRREYYDHFMRSEEEFQTARAYIERNPVAAGLVSAPEDWRWSSAWSGRDN
jgi:REP element-mobilizing transposase RayT